MQKNDTRLKEYLSSKNFSLSTPRQAIFKALQQSKPLSMLELIKAVPKVDRASVYRTIALYEKLGIVQRLQIGWKYKLELSDKFSYHHHHAVCSNCGQIVTLKENSQLERKINLLAASQNFAISDHQLEIRGLCSNCQT